MLFLVLAAVLESNGAAFIESLQPRQVIQVPRGEVGYARDAEYEYLATTNGLYRASRLATGPLELMPAAGPDLQGAGVDGDALYVLRGYQHFSTWPQPTLLRSRDRGVTFEAVAEGLLDCSLAPRYPCEYVVPRQIAFGDGRVFLEAGGNLLASADGALTWSVLVGSSSGKPQPMTCPLVFDRIGTRMLFGSECPLDMAWIAAGTLRDDLLGWATEPTMVVAFPAIDNRNVQFIRHVGGGVVFASIEGGLLKSTDNGATFRYVIHHPLSGVAGRYPYAQHFLVSSRNPQVMLLGGFDKADDSGYLAISSDGGETWSDSRITGKAHVMMLAEDPEGRFMAALYDRSTKKMTLAEIELGERGSKRRAVRTR